MVYNNPLILGDTNMKAYLMTVHHSNGDTEHFGIRNLAAGIRTATDLKSRGATVTIIMRKNNMCMYSTKP